MIKRSQLLQLLSLVLFLVITTPIIAQDFYVPSTISKEAQSYIRSFSRVQRDATRFPSPTDLEGWKKSQDLIERLNKESNSDFLKVYQPKLIVTTLGGIPVADIHPKGWKDNKKVLIYIHGGAYTFNSAYDNNSYIKSIPMAHDTGLRVVAVDYTLAPFAKYDQVTDQVVAVVKALVKDGYQLMNIGIFGDSAGGGLAAAVALKLRDRGVGLLGAVVLWSPWADITEAGDTYFTLKDHDPLLIYKQVLANSAEAYADPKKYKHPYVSPVYGDFKKGFPPTLIQVGTKEIFLSNAVRLYQAIDTAGQIVKLDVYEGMWHSFQSYPTVNMPEAQLARKKSAAFLKKYLKY